MKARAGYTFVGVALIAATSIVVVRMRDTKEPGSAALLQPELSANGDDSQGRQLAHLRSEVTSLRGQLGAIRAGLDDVAKAKQPEPSTEEPSSDPSVAPTPEESRAQSAVEWREHMEQVAADFGEEPVDRSWSTEKHGFVEARLRSDPVLNAFASGIECRSSTCRVELTGDPTDINKQLPMFVHSLGQTLPSAEAERIDQPDGQVTMVLYVREHPAEPN